MANAFNQRRGSLPRPKVCKPPPPPPPPPAVRTCNLTVDPDTSPKSGHVTVFASCHSNTIPLGTAVPTSFIWIVGTASPPASIPNGSTVSFQWGPWNIVGNHGMAMQVHWPDAPDCLSNDSCVVT